MDEYLSTVSRVDLRKQRFSLGNWHSWVCSSRKKLRQVGPKIMRRSYEKQEIASITSWNVSQSSLHWHQPIAASHSWPQSVTPEMWNAPMCLLPLFRIIIENTWKVEIRFPTLGTAPNLKCEPGNARWRAWLRSAVIPSNRRPSWRRSTWRRRAWSSSWRSARRLTTMFLKSWVKTDLFISSNVS